MILCVLQFLIYFDPFDFINVNSWQDSVVGAIPDGHKTKQTTTNTTSF